MISAILLTAGFSSRYGSPKALITCRGKKLITMHQEKLINAPIKEIVIVLGADREQIEPHILKHRKLKVVHNKNYKFGQTSSFKTGLNAVNAMTSGILLLPVDYPFIAKNTFGACISYFNEKKPLILIPVYNQKKGHPPIFNVQLKEELLALDDAVGINKFSQKYLKETEMFAVQDKGVVQTFNTPEEFMNITDENLPY